MEPIDRSGRRACPSSSRHPFWVVPVVVVVCVVVTYEIASSLIVGAELVHVVHDVDHAPSKRKARRYNHVVTSVGTEVVNVCVRVVVNVCGAQITVVTVSQRRRSLRTLKVNRDVVQVDEEAHLS